MVARMTINPLNSLLNIASGPATPVGRLAESFSDLELPTSCAEGLTEIDCSYAALATMHRLKAASNLVGRVHRISKSIILQHYRDFCFTSCSVSAMH